MRTGLSSKDLNRVEVLGRVKAGHASLVEAAELLGLSYRQTKRVWGRFRAGGAKGLRHRGRGRESNRGYGREHRERVLRRYGERYGDFGPTLAAEHLAGEGLAVSAESLRRWLRESGQKGVRKRKPYRQRRERRAHFGELVQTMESGSLIRAPGRTASLFSAESHMYSIFHGWEFLIPVRATEPIEMNRPNAESWIVTCSQLQTDRSIRSLLRISTTT